MLKKKIVSLFTLSLSLSVYLPNYLSHCLSYLSGVTLDSWLQIPDSRLGSLFLNFIRFLEVGKLTPTRLRGSNGRGEIQGVFTPCLGDDRRT